MFAKSIAVVALLAGLAVSQTNSTVNIGALSLTMKGQWCGAQQATCPELCPDYIKNDCDSNTLVVNCTCANGTAPGLDYYINTIPTFLCEELHTECKANNAGSATAQKACDDAEKADCGTLDPAKYTAPTSTSSSASSSATVASATSAAASAAATTTSKAAAAPTMGLSRELGTGIFAVGAAAAFGLMI
ncbi:hypothetical protein LHYA1_G002970 [Lachnellula hyalina]|uniref:DUF7707 domain-containing protein n=1 Tax=Lachnellula hyalina TaxID=1316788 RepID=A0A8H8R450_9HELO|nr:uncharacterized protein LHYA1_G002970 [Lachnellula hyalina]TVY27365.1 hypothetical protein LHYA1_G002970 [Lachnellula hyalina]